MRYFQRMAFAALTLTAASPASAAYVVDTGTPTGIFSPVLGRSHSIAGYFTLATNTVVTSVEGFIFGPSPAGIAVNIHRDAPLPGVEDILFTSSFIPVPLTTQPGTWQGVTGQSWTLAAGSYWVSFVTNGSYSMLSGAPNPLARYARSNGATWGSDDGLNVGIRVASAAVPEPRTWAMMIFGFGLVGGVMRRRAATVRYV